LSLALVASPARAVVPGPGQLVGYDIFDGSQHTNDGFFDTARCPDGSVVAVGCMNGDPPAGGYAVVDKFRTDGSGAWSAGLGVPGADIASAEAVAVDSHGNVVVAGRCWNGGNFDMFAAKLDVNGIQQWAAVKAGHADSYDEAYDVAVDGAGNVYVGGYLDQAKRAVVVKYAAAADPAHPGQGKALWTNVTTPAPGGTAVVDRLALGGGYVYATGERTVAHHGVDVFVRKIRGSGVTLWTKGWNGAANLSDAPGGIRYAGGRIYVAGYTKTRHHATDVLLVRYSTAGHLVWARTWDDARHGGDEMFDLAVDSHGSAYVAANTWPGGGIQKGVLAKWASDGTRRWLHAYQGISGQGGAQYESLTLSAGGTAWLVGYVATPTYPQWLAVKYTNAGKRVWVFTFAGPPNDPKGGFLHSGCLLGDQYLFAGGDLAQTGHAMDALAAWIVR
jgi:hypothetical protein